MELGFYVERGGLFIYLLHLFTQGKPKQLTLVFIGSAAECQTRSRESLGSNPPFATSRFRHFCSLHDASVYSELCINDYEYLAIYGGGNMS